jgi:hypothetical protein
LQLQSSSASLNSCRSDMPAAGFIKHRPICHLSGCKDMLGQHPDEGEGLSI